MSALMTELLHDPCSAARRYHQQGGRVIGYAGPDIPVELIMAAGALPMRIAERPELDISQANRYFEHSFLPSSLSLVEQYLRGDLDHLDALILPRSNDSLQRVYYYLCELQRRGDCQGPQVLIYDQAKIARDTSAQHMLHATEQLAHTLRSDLTRLPAAIAARNARRRLLAHARAQRQRGLSAAALHGVAQIADLAVPDEFDAALSSWLQQSPMTVAVPVLLAGSAPPDERLHRAIESAGGNVVAELNEAAANLVDTALVPEQGGLAALSQHYREYAGGSRAFVDRAVMLEQLLHGSQPGAVIHWLIEQDEALVWSLPQELAVARAAQLPTLTLTRRTWRADDGALDAIVQFVSQLRQRA